MFVLVGVAVAAKVMVRVLLGIGLAAGPARGTGADFGLSMVASGGFTIAVALAFSTRVPGIASDAVLLFAVVSTILGEWLAPAALRRSLDARRRAARRGAGRGRPPQRRARRAIEPGESRMSGHGSAQKGLATRAVQALALAVSFGVLFALTHLTPDVESRLGTMTAIGFLVLAGTLLSELLEPLGLPHLSGYLLAGIVGGPHVLHLVDHTTSSRSSRRSTRWRWR